MLFISKHMMVIILVYTGVVSFVAVSGYICPVFHISVVCADHRRTAQEAADTRRHAVGVPHPQRCRLLPHPPHARPLHQRESRLSNPES